MIKGLTIVLAVLRRVSDQAPERYTHCTVLVLHGMGARAAVTVAAPHSQNTCSQHFVGGNSGCYGEKTVGDTLTDPTQAAAKKRYFSSQ